MFRGPKDTPLGALGGPPVGPPGGPPKGPLDDFVCRARASSGSELLQVIEEALLHPDVFVYGELLALENVQQLESTSGCVEGPPCVEGGPRAVYLLRLLASGTVGDLVEMNKKLQGAPIPPLLLQKLRLLTIVSRCSVSSRVSFKDLQKDLEAPGCCEQMGAPTMHAGAPKEGPTPDMLGGEPASNSPLSVSGAAAAAATDAAAADGATDAAAAADATAADAAAAAGRAAAVAAAATADTAAAAAHTAAAATHIAAADTAAAGAAAADAAAGKAYLTELEVEELVVKCLRLGLVWGRIDGDLGCIDTWGALNRDPSETDIEPMLAVLKSFYQRTHQTLLLLIAAKDKLQQQQDTPT
ncbi:hypothetical protein, conserved [Eimeria acervulina]|uniref:Uncharacterized protein n=1 Tax=Eimeria acervulina TaxID=5801 RepID=U6GNA6_EIMAC|nr:hypothetical protein, conserved [Eimeria acervulina]CDI81042.1 hypothetical protein, conserved [Eimeria acervulina]